MTVLENVLRDLRSGGVALIPTDTVYGIAASPDFPGAVDKVFELKQRSRDKALPVLAASAEDLEGVVVLDDKARRVARMLWPGGLTLVLRRAPECVYDLGGADPETLAVRIPRCAPTQELLGESGPLAVTSANLSGRPPASSAEAATALFGGPAPVVLEGGTQSGRPSTIVSLVNEPKLLRTGEVDYREVLSALSG
jgi:L-threonylcarbamoyladenylate synthase